MCRQPWSVLFVYRATWASGLRTTVANISFLLPFLLYSIIRVAYRFVKWVRKGLLIVEQVKLYKERELERLGRVMDTLWTSSFFHSQEV